MDKWSAFEELGAVHLVADAHAIEGELRAVGDDGVDTLPVVHVRVEAVRGARLATRRSSAPEVVRLTLNPETAKDLAGELLDAANRARSG